MVQIDVFLAYGLGAAVALRGGRRRADSEASPEARRFSWTLLWLGAAFAPQTMYLLWRFPAWETMFVFGAQGEIPAWFAALAPAAMVVVGAAGYRVTAALKERGRERLAASLIAIAGLASLELVTVGWDGAGYQRLLYPGSAAEWAAGVSYPVRAFFTGEVARTLAWLVPLVMGPYVALLFGRRRRGTEPAPAALREARS